MNNASSFFFRRCRLRGDRAVKPIDGEAGVIGEKGDVRRPALGTTEFGVGRTQNESDRAGGVRCSIGRRGGSRCMSDCACWRCRCSVLRRSAGRCRRRGLRVNSRRWKRSSIRPGIGLCSAQENRRQPRRDSEKAQDINAKADPLARSKPHHRHARSPSFVTLESRGTSAHLCRDREHGSDRNPEPQDQGVCQR